jgi:hypothetical protein
MIDEKAVGIIAGTATPGMFFPAKEENAIA